MGLFEKLFSKNNDSLIMGGSSWETLTTYKPVFRTYNERLFESELVVAAIDARARHISKLKVDFVGVAKEKFKTAVKHRPNSFMTWSQFLYRLSVILDMQGTAFIVPVYDKYGEESGLFPILPSACSLLEYKGVVYIRYTFRNNKRAAIELDKVGIMTRHQYEDDIFGTNNNKALAPVLGVMDLNNQGIKEAIKSSASYRFMAQVNNFTKAEDLKKERQRFTEENLSGENSGLLLFPNTYTNIKQVDSKNYILDDKQMSFIRTSVFDFFGVNEDIIQNKANSENFESFYEGAIEPFAVQLEQVMSNMIFTQYEQSFGNKAVIASSKLTRLSAHDKLEFVQIMADRGLMTVNEIRVDILNLAPVEGGDTFPRRGEYYFGGLETVNAMTYAAEKEEESNEDAN